MEKIHPVTLLDGHDFESKLPNSRYICTIYETVVSKFLRKSESEVERLP